MILNQFCEFRKVCDGLCIIKLRIPAAVHGYKVILYNTPTMMYSVLNSIYIFFFPLNYVINYYEIIC